jgi:hypothetical protein
MLCSMMAASRAKGSPHPFPGASRLASLPVHTDNHGKTILPVDN